MRVEKNQNPDCFPLKFIGIIPCWIGWSSPDQGKFQKDTRDLLGKTKQNKTLKGREKDQIIYLDLLSKGEERGDRFMIIFLG